MTNVAIDRSALSRDVTSLLQAMMAELDTDLSIDIDQGTGLVRDLCFESIDFVMLVVAIEDRFNCKSLPFEELLMVDGRYVEDVEVGELVDFLMDKLA